MVKMNWAALDTGDDATGATTAAQQASRQRRPTLFEEPTLDVVGRAAEGAVVGGAGLVGAIRSSAAGRPRPPSGGGGRRARRSCGAAASPVSGSVGLGQGDGVVEPGDGVRVDLQEEAVQRRDLLPVGVLVGRRAGVAGRDGGLELVLADLRRAAAPPRPRPPRPRCRRGATGRGPGRPAARGRRRRSSRVARRASVSTIRAWSPSTSGSSGMSSTSSAASRVGLVAQGAAHVLRHRPTRCGPR